ncbi:MAG: hypothetical protein Q4E43_04545 [Akkermansia sp.]|nr:hypothetical protein [Akkermansia sp.]
MLTPFMVAMAPETPAQQPQAPAAIYNWENQGSVNLNNEDDAVSITSGTWSYPPGMQGPAQVDDTMLC